MNINIRKAERSDYIQFKNLMVQLQQHHINLRPDVYRMSEDFFTEATFDKLLEECNVLVAADENGQIAGAVSYSIMDMKGAIIHPFKSLWISDLVISENHRRQGIGSMLMEKVKETAKENDVDRIQLNVSSYNTDAVKLYEKLGFTPEMIKMEYIFDKG